MTVPPRSGGCVLGGRGAPTPGIVEALEALRQAEKGIAFATNNAYESGEDLWPAVEGRRARFAAGHGHTVGGAMSARPRRDPDRPHSVRDRHPGDVAPRKRRRPQGPERHRPRLARGGGVVVAGTTDLVYRRPAERRAGGRAAPTCSPRPAIPPTPRRRPLAGTGAVLAAVDTRLARTPSLWGQTRASTLPHGSRPLAGPHAGRWAIGRLRPGGRGGGGPRRRLRAQRRRRPRGARRLRTASGGCGERWLSCWSSRNGARRTNKRQQTKCWAATRLR